MNETEAIEAVGCDPFSDDLKSKVQEALKTFEEALEQYELEEIFLSFNGGKDCTVLLHKLVEHIKRLGKDPRALKVYHMEPMNPFQEIEKFVEECRKFYGVDMRVIQGPIKQVLQDITGKHPELKAVFMGNRRTDPWCDKLSVFKKTDPGWPELMRINPILNWTHANVWEYLLKKKVPYCELYDQGYTSIGDKTNTIPNPNLKVVNPDGTESYLPAYKLLENADKLERAGRL